MARRARLGGGWHEQSRDTGSTVRHQHLWVSEKALARLNLKIADALRTHMPPELRAVLIVDFEPRMSLLLDAFMKLRYVLARRSEEIRTICGRAAVSA